MRVALLTVPLVVGCIDIPAFVPAESAQGAQAPTVFLDFDLSCRPAGDAADVGAFEREATPCF